MKQLTRDEIIKIIENKIEEEKEFERLFTKNFNFEDTLRHYKKRVAYEELLEDINNAEERK